MSTSTAGERSPRNAQVGAVLGTAVADIESAAPGALTTEYYYSAEDIVAAFYRQ